MLKTGPPGDHTLDRCASLASRATGKGSSALSRPTVSRCSQFPDVSAGRGFTQAHGLRERLAFSGEIRAMGYILPGQLSR
jgi:Bacterial protein of unknown function (DUF934)